MSVCVRADFFSPEQILDSGQCFRMTRLENGRIQVLAGARRTELEQTAAGVLFHCTEAEYETFWKSYFDLEADYGAYADKINSRDDFLRRAAQYGRGVRILRQEPWEMIVTFLISQQNNIKRIRRCIEALCERYGAPVYDGGDAEPLFRRRSSWRGRASRRCGRWGWATAAAT